MYGETFYGRHTAQHQLQWSLVGPTKTEHQAPTDLLNFFGRSLQCVWGQIYTFTYLDNALSRAVHNDDEVNGRIAEASVAFGRLCRIVWEQSGTRLDTKLEVYKKSTKP